MKTAIKQSLFAAALCLTPPLAFANTVPSFLDNAYVKAGIAHNKQTYTYQEPNYPNVTNKVSSTGYSLSLGKEFSEYDVGLTLTKVKDTDVSYTLYGNKDFANINVGLSYSLPSTRTYSSSVVANATNKNKESNIRADVIYNFDKNTALTPFVSASITRYSSKTTVTNNAGETLAQASSNSMRYGIGVGAKYKLTPNVTLDGGIDYYKSNDIQVGNTTNSYDGYGVNVGIKYQF